MRVYTVKQSDQGLDHADMYLLDALFYGKTTLL